MKTATLLLVLFTCCMPAVARKYKYLDYQQIADELHELAKVCASSFVEHASILYATVLILAIVSTF